MGTISNSQFSSSRSSLIGIAWAILLSVNNLIKLDNDLAKEICCYPYSVDIICSSLYMQEVLQAMYMYVHNYSQPTM